jgi:Tol biopolymer transport system component
MRAELDGLLTDAQRRDLDAHLRECEGCRVESEFLSMLTTCLRSSFQGRWDAQDGPSERVLNGVLSKKGRIIMSNRINSVLKVFAGIAALLVLGFLINLAISQIRDQSIASSATQINAPVSPDKRLIAFTSTDDKGNSDIYIVHSDGSSLTNITNNLATDTSPAWSPDGNRLAFLSDRNGQWDIFSMKSDGSELTRLTDGEETAYGFSWSPNENQIAYYAASTQNPNLQNIIIMDADGSNKTVLTNEPGSYFLPSWLPDAHWSPDGSRLVFLEQTGQSDKEARTKFYTVNVDGTSLQEIANVDGAVRDMRWQGNHIIALLYHLTATGERNWELYRLSMDGAPPQKLASHDKRIVNWFGDLPNLNYIVETGPVTWSWFKTDGKESTPLNVWKNKFQDCRSFEIETEVYDALSPDGKKLLVSSFCKEGHTWIYLVNSDGSEIKRLVIEPVPGQVMMQATWSLDGNYVILQVYPDTSKNFNFDYYILNVADTLLDPATRPTRLTTDSTADKGDVIIQPITNSAVNELSPTTEPTQTSSNDGLIAFVSGSEAGNEEIFTMHADGSGLTNLTNDPATDTAPAWSPDGTRIAFGSDRNGDMDIYVMDAGGSNLTRLTDDRGYEGYFSWSPDGQRIVYTASDNSLINDGQLVVMNADGSNKTALTEPGNYIFLGWSPNGQKIVYLNQNSEKIQDNEIHIVDINGANHYKWRAIIDEIKWTDEGHFIGHGWNGKDELPSWNIYKFDAEGSDPIELATYPSRVVALFDQTYLVEDMRTLSWYSLDGTTTPLKSWDFGSHCKKQGDRFMPETGHTISPDGTRAFVTVYCFDGTIWFYLENTDGSQFVQLTDFSLANPSQVSIDMNWSPDARFLFMMIGRTESDKFVGSDLYLFDIEKMQNDPSTMPIQITTDGAWKYGIAWQPQP